MKRVVISLLLAMAIIAPSMIASLNAGNFFPPDVSDCEDLEAIDLPPDLMLGDIIPPGLSVDTTCGECLLGYQLNCYYDYMTDDFRYYCEYIGIFGLRCYYIQTNSLF